MPTPSPLLTGTAPDLLLNQGQPPKADLTKEYMASGSASFPLIAQVVLSHGIDDLSRDFGLQIYEVMGHDPTVASGVGVLTTGILGGEFQILPAMAAEPGKEPDPDKAADIDLAQEIAEFCQRQVNRLDRPVKSICMEFVDNALRFGTRLAEIVLEPGEGDDKNRLVLKRLRFKRGQAWAFVVDAYGEVIAIRCQEVGGGLVDLPARKFAVMTWMPTEGDPRGHSILRGAYNGYNLKINTWPKYYKYLDKFGSPTIIGITGEFAVSEPAAGVEGIPDGTDLTPTQALFYTLQKIEGGAVAALPRGTEVTLVQAQGNGEAFKAAFEIFDREILKGILLSARATMEAEHGSKADSETSQDVVERLLSFGRETQENVWEDQIFHFLTELNWGKEVADRLSPTVSLGKVLHEDVAKVATAYAAIGYQIAESAKPALDAKLNLPVRTAEEMAAAADAADEGEGAGDDADAADDTPSAPGWTLGGGKGKSGGNGKGGVRPGTAAFGEAELAGLIGRFLAGHRA